MDIKSLLEQKQQEHGAFEDNAVLAQALKTQVRSASLYYTMTAVEQEAIDQICSKIARHISKGGMRGGGGIDNPTDIVGYGVLMRQLYEEAPAPVDYPIDSAPSYPSKG